MKKQLLYRLATLLVPILCLFGAGAMIFVQAHRLQQSSRDLAANQKQMVQLERLVKDLEAQPPVTVTPTLAQSPIEQPDFLTIMRTYADVTHVQLTRWSNTESGPPRGSAADATKKPLPSGVTPITSAIEVAGDFNALRQFLYSLESAPRLFSLSNMVWARNDKWPITFLKFNLTRYISQPGLAPMQVAPAALPVKPAAVAGPSIASAPAKAASAGPTIIAALPQPEGLRRSLPAGSALSPGGVKEAATKGNP